MANGIVDQGTHQLKVFGNYWSRPWGKTNYILQYLSLVRQASMSVKCPCFQSLEVSLRKLLWDCTILGSLKYQSLGHLYNFLCAAIRDYEMNKN